MFLPGLTVGVKQNSVFSDGGLVGNPRQHPRKPAALSKHPGKEQSLVIIVLVLLHYNVPIEAGHPRQC